MFPSAAYVLRGEAAGIFPRVFVDQVLFHTPVDGGFELSYISIDAGHEKAVSPTRSPSRFQISSRQRVHKTVGQKLRRIFTASPFLRS